ncbi:MAG: hypothetical protein WC464_01705 [Bdellovibrionales bacterium]
MPSLEIIFEIQRIGAIVRVSAIEAENGTEVVFQAPATTSNEDLKRLATNKLKYVLKRQAAKEHDFYTKK